MSHSQEISFDFLFGFEVFFFTYVIAQLLYGIRQRKFPHPLPSSKQSTIPRTCFLWSVTPTFRDPNLIPFFFPSGKDLSRPNFGDPLHLSPPLLLLDLLLHQMSLTPDPPPFPAILWGTLSARLAQLSPRPPPLQLVPLPPFSLVPISYSLPLSPRISDWGKGRKYSGTNPVGEEKGGSPPPLLESQITFPAVEKKDEERKISLRHSFTPPQKVGNFAYFPSFSSPSPQGRQADRERGGGGGGEKFLLQSSPPWWWRRRRIGNNSSSALFCLGKQPSFSNNEYKGIIVVAAVVAPDDERKE